MSPALLRTRRLAYRAAAVLALAYGVYVVGLELAARATGGPLGEVGEFALVLAAVTCFAVGLFADEAARAQRPPTPASPAPDSQAP